MRVELFGQLKEFGQLFVRRLQLVGRDRKEFSPMRADMEGRQFPFDDGQQRSDGGPILFPGKVNCDGRLIAAGTHPEVVRSDGADF